MSESKEPSGRLIELKISNFMRIKAVAIRPDGHVVTIAGRNDQGKSSLLKSIWALLAGQAAAPAKVIRQGEEECRLYGDFGELKVTRIFRHSKDGDPVTMSLKVTQADGTPVKGRVQGTLDKLLGAYAFDPLAFARAPAKVQYDTLKGLVPGFNFDDNAAGREKVFEARTDINRKLDQEKAALAGIHLPPGACPKPIDVSAQLDEIEKANAANAARTAEIARRSAMTREIATFDARVAERLAEIDRLRARMAELEKEAAQINASSTAAKASLAGPPEIPAEIDIAPIRTKISEADKVKGIRALFQQRTEREEAIEALEGEAAELTERIAILDAEKAKAIAGAKMPVRGLSFGDNEVLLNDIPFAQQGTRVKIMTSTMIAMALNPSLRIMTIDEGSEIDKEGMALLEKLAEQHDFTVLVAKVDEHGANGFIMEDGMLQPTSQAAE